MQIQEVINELNNLALSLDGPLPLIKWAIMTAPHVIELDFICVALIRLDSALFNYGSISGPGDPRLGDFKDKVDGKISELAAREFIREERRLRNF